MQITKKELRTLNAARKALQAIEERAQDEGYDRARAAANEDSYDGGSRAVMAMGRLVQTCDTAEAAIFRVLNVAKSYGGVKMTDDELHGREAVAA